MYVDKGVWFCSYCTVLISATLHHVTGAEHIPEEWGQRAEYDVRETREVGIHVPELRLHQPRAGSDEISQREAEGGRGSRAVL